MPLVAAPPAASLPSLPTRRLGRALSNDSAPITGFYWFRTRLRREVPPPPLAAAVGAAFRRRGVRVASGEERRHVVCCCADGQAFRSRSGSNSALPGTILGRRDAMRLPPRQRGPTGRRPMGSGPMGRQPSAPRQAPPLYHPSSLAGRVTHAPVSRNASCRCRCRRAPRTTRS